MVEGRGSRAKSGCGFARHRWPRRGEGDDGADHAWPLAVPIPCADLPIADVGNVGKCLRHSKSEFRRNSATWALLHSAREVDFLMQKSIILRGVPSENRLNLDESAQVAAQMSAIIADQCGARVAKLNAARAATYEPRVCAHLERRLLSGPEYVQVAKERIRAR